MELASSEMGVVVSALAAAGPAVLEDLETPYAVLQERRKREKIQKEQRREKLRKAMERKRMKRLNSCSNCDGFINGGSRHDTRENLVCLENNQHNGDSIKLDWDWDSYLKNSILYNSTLEYLHFIDSVSRKLFPLTFLLCNVIYWTSYIYVL